MPVPLSLCRSSDLMTWTMKINYLEHTEMFAFTAAVRQSWRQKLGVSVLWHLRACVLVKSRRWLCGTAVKAALLGGITWNDTQR